MGYNYLQQDNEELNYRQVQVVIKALSIHQLPVK